MLSWQPGQPLQLTTRRFTLRSLGPGDATPLLLSWLTDAKLMHWLGGPRPLPDLQALKGFIAHHDNQRKFWIGIFRDRRLVGFLWLDVALDDKNARSHHFIGDRRLWGTAAALEARAAVMDWLFWWGMQRVFGTPNTGCRTALAGYRRQGFTYEGTFASAMAHPDGNRYDIAVFRMLPEEWRAQKETKGPLGQRRDGWGDPPPAASDPRPTRKREFPDTEKG
ncbi:MAG: GNAT family protein [Pseudomonadota bacterium]